MQLFFIGIDNNNNIHIMIFFRSTVVMNSMSLEVHCWPSWMITYSIMSMEKENISTEIILVIQSTCIIIAMNTSTYVYIALQTRQLTTDSTDQKDLITVTDSSDFPSFSHPRMSIEIPTDLVKMFINMSGMGSNGVRLVSFLYANVTGLFPQGEN